MKMVKIQFIKSTGEIAFEEIVPYKEDKYPGVSYVQGESVNLQLPTRIKLMPFWCSFKINGEAWPNVEFINIGNLDKWDFAINLSPAIPFVTGFEKLANSDVKTYRTNSRGLRHEHIDPAF